MLSNLERKSQLDTAQLVLFESEIRKKSKNMWAAYALWYFFGGFGAHRFYLGRKGSAIGQLIVGLIAFFALITFYVMLLQDALAYKEEYSTSTLVPVIIAIIFGIALGIWVIVDAFLVHLWVRKHNAKVEEDLLNEFNV